MDSLTVTVPPSSDKRRSFSRYEVNLVAEVRDPAGNQRRAQVRDLCLGGALLAGLDEAWLMEIRPGTTLDLDFVLAASLEIGTVPVRARVARVIEGGLGVQFEASTRPELEGLRNLIERILARTREASRPEGEAERRAKASRNRAAAIIARFGKQHLEAVIKAWIEAADAALWKASDHAGDGGQKQRLTDDAMLLRRLGSSGPARLWARLRDTNDEALGPVSEHLSRGQKLELVDRDRFECWLEAATLISRLEDALRDGLTAIEAQIRNALGSDAHPPIGPRRLIDAFNAWGDAEGLSPQGRRVVLRSGRQALPGALGTYYRDLGRALEEAGFPRVKVQDPSVAAWQVVAAPNDQGLAPPPLVATPEDDTPRSVAPTRSRYTARDVAEFLASLRADARWPNPDGTPGSIEAQVLQRLRELDSGLHEQPLPASVRERIELADRVLTRLAGKQAHTPRSAQWASQLGFPIFTAAVSDPAFFRPPGHPLIQLLERLARLALFLPTDREADKADLLRELDELVRQACAVDARDRGAFQPLLDAVGTLERHRGERYRRDIKRAIWQLEGRDRRRAALGHVRTGLERRFAGRPMHRVVTEVLDAGWATLLQLQYLREGEGSEQLARAWRVLEGLVAVCSEEGSDPRQGIEDLAPELVSGLAFVGVDPRLTQDLTQRVWEAVRQQAAGHLTAADCPIYQPPPESKVPMEVALAGLRPERAASLNAQVDGLAPWGMMRLRETDGEHLLRLVWSSWDRMEFAFLDGGDGQLRQFSREALILGLDKGKLELQFAGSDNLGDGILDATIKEMHDQLRHHEARDRLTGLCLSHQLEGRLAEALARPVDGAYLLGFLDIDHFDVVTGACGYGAGEELLRTVAGLLQQRLGPHATLAFLGGWRFGFLLPAGVPETSLTLCEQLRGDVSRVAFQWQGEAYPVTCSLGVVIARPGTGDPDGLLSAAAVACTTARENGGNRLQIFSETSETISRSRERLRWISRVEDVIKAERIRLRVQMIVPLDPESGRRPHHEVLMQALDAQGNELDLGRFIAIAEAYKLMGDVDRLVLRKAISWAGENPELLRRLGGIAINLSGVSLANPELPQLIETLLGQAGVAPELVSFEVTETTAIANLKRAETILNGIRNIGCRVALDDFGVGMSTYAYLKSLPVDFIKIDGFFVRDLLNSPHDLAIVKSINEIAHFMGIETIAEFAERDEIVAQLAQLGVDFVQGYAVGEPLLLDQVTLGYTTDRVQLAHHHRASAPQSDRAGTGCNDPLGSEPAMVKCPAETPLPARVTQIGA